jgi:ribonuclease BN (tRNA processing enzyme)
MAAAGLDPKAVKTILISHLHGDHIYGLMNHETKAQVFPEAEIVVPATELQ